MLYLLLTVIGVELAIIILAWPEARTTAGQALKAVGVALALLAGYVLHQNAPELYVQFRAVVPSWRTLGVATTFAATVAVGLLLFLVGGVGAYGWVGDRSITRWAPDSRLYVLLAAGVGMICAFCAVLLLGGLDPKALLGTKERIWWIMGGGLGEILALAWILVGLHRLRKQGRKLLPTIRRVV